MRAVEKRTLFEYECPECEAGVVRTTAVLNFKTKIKGYPFVVPEALIGICDSCKSEQFAPEETKRWEDLFYRSLEERQAFLSPSEINHLRTTLGLSMGDFAHLIGCTRQSVAVWEKPNRPSPPSRMGDLLMKLVGLSLQSRTVDVLGFLVEEAKRWGAVIEVRRGQALSGALDRILLRVRKVSRKGLGSPSMPQSNAPSALPLAAEERKWNEETILAETSDGSAIGELGFDYEQGALFMEITGALPSWKAFDVEVVTNDNQRFARKGASIEQHRLILLERVPLRAADIAMVELAPAVAAPR